MDSGQYRCEAHGERKEEVAVIHLHVAKLKLVTEANHSFPFQMIKTSIGKRNTIYTLAGDEATLPCYLSPKRCAVAMEIRWFKGTDCIFLYQNGQVKQEKSYEGRVSLFIHQLREGNVSLMLTNVQKSDVGEYKCEVTHQEYKLENSGIYIKMSDFKLIPKPEESSTFCMKKTSIAYPHIVQAFAGDDVTLPCYLFPKKSAVAMEIRWIKGTDCICVYQHGQVKEGKGYEGRVSLFTHELEEGNVSLRLRNVQVSDGGEYKCEMSHEEHKVENSGVDLQVSDFKLFPKPDDSFILRICETSFTKPYIIYGCDGDDVTLPCYLSPKKSVISMEIRWFKETDCICVYQNGQVKEGQGYEGRVSLFTHELEKGNVSLMLRNVQESDGGEYKCKITRREHKMENSGVYLRISEFKLVQRTEDVGKPTGSDSGPHLVEVLVGDNATMPYYIAPKMSAVAMEIRWFKGTDDICLYQDGQVKVGRGYEGRVSLFTNELEEGNVSLMLRNVQGSRDCGQYKCEVMSGDEKVETSVYLIIIKVELCSGKGDLSESSDDDTPRKPGRRGSMPLDFPSKKPGRRWSNPGDVPN
ncbi:butyrophilin 2 isoform X1, partial [Clarias magur]